MSLNEIKNYIIKSIFNSVIGWILFGLFSFVILFVLPFILNPFCTLPDNFSTKDIWICVKGPIVSVSPVFIIFIIFLTIPAFFLGYWISIKNKGLKVIKAEYTIGNKKTDITKEVRKNIICGKLSINISRLMKLKDTDPLGDLYIHYSYNGNKPENKVGIPNLTFPNMINDPLVHVDWGRKSKEE